MNHEEKALLLLCLFVFLVAAIFLLTSAATAHLTFELNNYRLTSSNVTIEGEGTVTADLSVPVWWLVMR